MAASRVPSGPVTLAYDVRAVVLTYRSRRGEANAAATRALDVVTLEIGRGDCAVIVGRSGSGKSSLLNVLGGLEKPESGTIVCSPAAEEQFPLHRLPEDDCARFRARYVGFVYQAFHLLPALKAWENVAVPLVFTRVPLADRRDRAHALLHELGLSDMAERFPYELSGGEQQRIALARALTNNPAILLADEPTGNLDSKSAGTVIDMIREVHQSKKVTMVIVTHDTAVAHALSTRTIEMNDGGITGYSRGPR